jgi:hypothetical protein
MIDLFLSCRGRFSAGGRRGGLQVEEDFWIKGGRKSFFFEKKKQKTFAPAGVGTFAATTRI